MTDKRLGPMVAAGILAVVCALLASPAFAQVGSLRGRVVDEAGKPVAGADVLFEQTGEKNRATTKTNAKGEFVLAGLLSGQRIWSVSATKGDLTGGVRNVTVPYKAVGDVPDIVVHAPSRSVDPIKAAGERTAEETAKKQAVLNKLFDEATTATNSNAYDVAIAKLTEVIGMAQQCGLCYQRLGDVNAKKGDLPAAEAAYTKAVELDPKSAEAFEGLAGVFNAQKKYVEAGEATKKATDLKGASGGGGDAVSFFNAGVILWNQSKIPEAAVEFEKAVKVDPQMADAQYYYGMSLINAGKLPEAKAALQQYLKLAPTGQYAETVKGILGSI